MMLDARPYAGDDDLEPVLALLTRCQLAGTADMEFRSMELRLRLRDPAFDRGWTRLWEREGRLVAFAVLFQGHYLALLISPEACGLVEADALGWALAALRARGERTLFAVVRSDDTALCAFLEREGFVLDEEELRMRRPLDLPLPEPLLPPGFTLRTLRPGELDDWLALYQVIGGPPFMTARWRALRGEPDWDPTLDLVITDADDRIAAACTCTITRREWERLPLKEGRTEPVMVSERYRRIGLGRAAVTAGLHALRNRGAQVAWLTTEEGNAIAHRLYRSLGYEVAYAARFYARAV